MFKIFKFVAWFFDVRERDKIIKFFKSISESKKIPKYLLSISTTDDFLVINHSLSVLTISKLTIQ